MPVKYIQHKGKTILYVDYSNQSGEQGIATLNEQAKEMGRWTEKGLILDNFQHSKASPDFMAHAKKLGKEVFAPRAYKTAAVGLTGLQMILVQAYNAFSKDKLVPFNSEEEAKDWLVKD